MKSSSKVHSFGKRDQAIRRNLSVPVVVRGWLHKQVRWLGREVEPLLSPFLTLVPGSWEQTHNKLSVPEFVWGRLIPPTVLSDLLFVLWVDCLLSGYSFPLQLCQHLPSWCQRAFVIIWLKKILFFPLPQSSTPSNSLALQIINQPNSPHCLLIPFFSQPAFSGSWWWCHHCSRQSG